MIMRLATASIRVFRGKPAANLQTMLWTAEGCAGAGYGGAKTGREKKPFGGEDPPKGFLLCEQGG